MKLLFLVPSGAIELYVAFVTIVFKIFVYIYDCAMSSLPCGLFSSCSEQGLLFVAVCGLLIAVASHVEHRLSGVRVSVAAAPGI